MTMPTKKTLEYFDYFEVEGIVAERIGRSLRDYKNGKDFWAEYIVDQIPGNDCYVTLYFSEPEVDTNEPWIEETCAVFRELIEGDSATFHISW